MATSPRYGSVTRVNSDPTTDQVFSARWLLNTSLGYAIDAWNFSLGVDNVTNQYPTRVKANNTGEDFASGLQYSALSPFGFNGRYYYARSVSGSEQAMWEPIQMWELIHRRKANGAV